MCGIAGLVTGAGKSPELAQWAGTAILDRIRHRGPDAEGQFQDGSVWLGHVRLSILDLSPAGNQPMTAAGGRFVICYNGEVYNFRELADSLSLLPLRSHSDTEVILRAFAKLGVAAFPRLNGMFAFAIYDTLSRRLWLVRDRLGIKPVYYRLDAGGFAFASEIKALFGIDAAIPECDTSALHEWLFYGNALGERTLYQGIRKLLPGHFLSLDIATMGFQVEAYWTPAAQGESRQNVPPSRDLIAETRRLLEQAVKRQLVSDVPVGGFLSGGIDSSAITAFASRHYQGRYATYTAGFDFAEGTDELPKARRVAQRFGTEHTEIHISGFEIADIVEKMVHHHDMPFSDAANIPLYLLAAKVSGKTKVVLQGDGGDEVFGGYRRYTTLSYYKLLRPVARFGQHVNRLTPHTAHFYRRERYLHAIAANDLAGTMALLLTEEDRDSRPASIFMPEVQARIEEHDPFARYRSCQRLFSGEDIVNQMLLVDSMIVLPDIFLEKVDRSAMAAGLEVRVPFLDHELVDYCMRIPGHRKVPAGRKKWLIKKALRGIVPDDVLGGPKTGFGVPFGFWLHAALKPLFFDHLARFQESRPGLLNSRTVHDWYDEHVSRRRDRAFLLWKLLNFLIWANQSRVTFRF